MFGRSAAASGASSARTTANVFMNCKILSRQDLKDDKWNVFLKNSETRPWLYEK